MKQTLLTFRTCAYFWPGRLPLHAYVLHCRIDRAKRLLLSTRRTVTSIGQELHFYSTQHFANTFKRIIGKYPQDFRLSTKADQALEG